MMGGGGGKGKQTGGCKINSIYVIHTASSKLFQSIFSLPRFTAPESCSPVTFSSSDRLRKLAFAAETKTCVTCSFPAENIFLKMATFLELEE